MARTKEPPVFNRRQKAWDLVMLRMEDQLSQLAADMPCRAPGIRKFISFAVKTRESVQNSTTGITIERDHRGSCVVVWVSALGRDRPIASIVLPTSPSWVLAQERYLETMEPIVDDRAKAIEQDEWL